MDKKRIDILLVEDDPDDVLLVKEILSQVNGILPKFALQSVERISGALERIAEHDPDIILLDLALPDSRGMETFTKLQTQAVDIPIVILTTHHDEAQALEAVGRGAEDYLVKGHLNKHVLVRTIRYAIERHRIRHRLLSVAKELRELNAKLEKLVQMDPLTELLNRRGLQDALTREVRWAQREETDLLGLILDLDNFKEINDTLGHSVGDVVLKEVAVKLKGAVRATDYVARVGGDEFLVLMPRTRFAEGLKVAEKIRLAVSGTAVTVSSRNQAYKITASVGLVPVASTVVSVDELLARSHLVLHRSKQGGKNRVSYEERGVLSEIPQSLGQILAMLRHGDRYRVVRQPIVRLADRSVVAYEFLSRVLIEGFEMPDDFFKLCLENNILTVVDFQCLKNCVADSQAMPQNARFHVNLFPSTIFEIPIKTLLETFPMDVPRGTYCLEVSEQQIIGDPSYLVEHVKEFRRAGVLVAIDDVGFGRSCLESLILLEPDLVKIDKRLVQGIAKNAWSRRSLVRVLKVAQALGTEVIAEGIESEEDFKLLQEIGVSYGQGYYLGHPV